MLRRRRTDGRMTAGRNAARRTTAGVAAVVSGLIGLGLVTAAMPAAADARQPDRVLDTRGGVGATRGRLVPGVVLQLPVDAARAAGASSVSLNLTATDAVGPGFVTAWPCGQPAPATSILNYVPGRVVANHAMVGIGPGGVCLAASQPVHLVGDLMGWFTDADYRGASPTRLLDTRATGDPLVAGAERRLSVARAQGYSAGAGAVALNVTVVTPAADGFAVAYPCGPRPLASTVNFRAGEIVANFTLVSLTGSEVCLSSNVAVEVVVDAFGWSSNATGVRLGAPSRLLDTRDGTGWRYGAATAAGPVTLRVAGRGTVPNDAAAVLLTLTATGGGADGFVTAWPCDRPRPLASVLNLRPGYLGSNLAYVPLSAVDGTVCLFASSTVHLVADAVGWETGGPTRAAPPPDGARFGTLPPGSALPDEDACAAAVRPAPEIRALNGGPNHTRGTRPNTVYPRVTGNFTGTTDEILQWAACKWGIDEDVVRAQIVQESWWRTSTVGDNGESFGLGQVRVGFHDSAFVDDNAKRSTAYNVDYTYAHWRACFEGRFTWLNDRERGGTYAAGDVWGCVGFWFSGLWHVPRADQYIASVQDFLARRYWGDPAFLDAPP